METPFNYAKNYRDKFGWSVIPIDREKHPLVKWKEFQTRLATDEELENWFVGKTFETTGIGLVTGRLSNLCAFDNDNGEISVDSNLKVKTSRGFHCYFKFRSGVKNKSKLEGDPVDIRGEGGYIVLPPSIHKTGMVYEWLFNKNKKLEEVLNELEIFPEGLFKKYYSFSLNLAKQRTVDYSKMGDLKEGMRDEDIFDYARSLFRYNIPFDRVLEICTTANRLAEPPLSEKIVLEKVKSAENYHKVDDLPPLTIGNQVMKEYEIAEKEDKHRAISKTGIEQIDFITGGIELGRIWSLIAGPGRGKSIFGIQCFDTAMKNGITSMYLSNEMSSEDINARLISRRINSSWRDILHNFPNVDQIKKQEAKNELDNLYISTSSGLATKMNTIEKIDYVIRTAVDFYGTQLFIIDHLHNIRGNSDIFTRISNSSTILQELASELNICLIILGQISLAARINNDPDTISAKGAADLEEKSDVFIFLERPAFGEVKEERMFIKKNRSGGTLGVVDVEYQFPSAIIKGKGNKTIEKAIQQAKDDLADIDEVFKSQSN